MQRLSKFGSDYFQLPIQVKSDSSASMRVRISLKLLLVIFTIIVIFTIFSYWTKCDSNPGTNEKHWHFKDRPCQTHPVRQKTAGIDIFQFDDKDDIEDNIQDQQVNPQSGLRTLEEIDCSINDEYTVPCRLDEGEVYVPFSFLHKYFEVYGKLVKQEGFDHFEWQHSYSKVYFPKRKYDPGSVYLWFENYNVEVRDRVKCISGAEGVPISTQWDTRGHFYPIQIAQFGLSHFSKNISEASYTSIVLEDGESTLHSHWKIPELPLKNVMLKKLVDSTVGNMVLEFKTYASSKDLMLIIDEDLEETTLSCNIMFISNASFTVVLNNPGDGTSFKVHYVMSDVLLSATETEVFYGVGKAIQWKTLTRDLIIDLNKGLPAMQNKRKMSKSRNLKIRSIIFHGLGRVDNITLSSSSHMAHFFASANWLINHQDDKGGWPNMVSRKLSNGMLELSPGWYSAMAQGQAMSLLTRAFRVTNDLRYLEAALRAIKLFSIRSENHGILTTFLGKYVWYEEYPTVPSSFVLNGFIYSLFGLYDVHQSCTHEHCRLAGQLFENGLISLKKMLPLFDTGSGSIYDLRHFSLGIAPNLARWDYHSTHINQLLFLSTIHSDPILKSVAERWAGYMKGKKAPHN